MRIKPLRSVAFAMLFSLAVIAQDVPTLDLFLGYSFLRVSAAQQIPAYFANGGIATLGLNLNDHFGFEAEFGGYTNGNVYGTQLDSTPSSYLLGPRVSWGRSKKVDLYFHTLFGLNRASISVPASSSLIPVPAQPVQPTQPVQPIAPPTVEGSYSASQVNFAMAIGGGIDFKVGHHVLLRPIQVDYFLARSQTPEFLVPGGSTMNRNQNNFRYAAGVAFVFGGEKPGPAPAPPPPEVPKLKSCPGGTSVPVDQECPNQNTNVTVLTDQTEICQDAISHLTAGGRLPVGAKTQWAVNGEPISQSASFEFGGAGRQPGSYKVTLKVTADGYNDASADAAITVRPYVPPSGSLSVLPSEIYVGDNATLTPSFRSGQCGGSMGPVSFSASEGAMNGNQFVSTGVRFDPAGDSEQQKTITVTAKVSDQRGSASAETTLVVKQRAAITAKRLPDILFPKGSARVNNCGKRVLLEELKSLFESDPTGTVVFVGHIAENESASAGLDQKRALNAAAVISAGEGICARFPASKILVNAAGSADNGVDFQPHFCEASAGITERPGDAVTPGDNLGKYRRVEVWFVPTGGSMPASAKGAKDAVSLGVSSLGCPK